MSKLYECPNCGLQGHTIDSISRKIAKKDLTLTRECIKCGIELTIVNEIYKNEKGD